MAIGTENERESESDSGSEIEEEKPTMYAMDAGTRIKEWNETLTN